MWETADIIQLDAVGSTNDEAKDRARQGAPEGTIVTAARQTAGRGRQGNRWLSAPGNLYMSLILRPKTAPTESGQLSFLAAVALAHAVEKLLPAGVKITLKWPNDLLLNGKKAAGILLETEASGGACVEWLVMGLGLNIAHAPENAISLGSLGGHIAPPDMAQMIRAEIMALYRVWREEGFAPIRDAWLARAAHKAQEINVRLPHETFRATFLGIDDAGALHVQLPDGQERHIASGEVFGL
jgi:BirA family biotin operon repressor/biotin-[acetyl-CoA-carboxylase] ligase